MLKIFYKIGFIKLLMFGFLLGAMNVQAESANGEEPRSFFDDSFNDLQEEVAVAKDDGKKALLLMFEMDECPFCHRMKTTIFTQKAVLDYFRENFRIISIDIEGDLELVDFEGNTTTQKDFSLQQHRVRATPVFMFFDLEGKPMKNGRFTGASKDAEEFLLLGKYIAENKNENMPFIKYKREMTK
jgi:thioredoxin-related protein